MRVCAACELCAVSVCVTCELCAVRVCAACELCAVVVCYIAFLNMFNASPLGKPMVKEHKKHFSYLCSSAHAC